jgi:hypothetical protein
MAKRRILMDMDTTLTWPSARPTKEKLTSKAASKPTYRPMMDCFFRTDGNSQGTVISSLASSRGNEVVVEKDNNTNKDNADEYEEEDMDQFAKDMEDTDINFDFTEEEDIHTKTTPTRQETIHEITSPGGMVTEGSKTLVMDKRREKV